MEPERVGKKIITRSWNLQGFEKFLRKNVITSVFILLTLFQILEHHIKTVLPSYKAELNCHMIAVVKELQAYGEVVESKVSSIV